MAMADPYPDNASSSSSTPFVSAPSSPRDNPSTLAFYLSRSPTSPNTAFSIDTSKTERTIMSHIIPQCVCTDVLSPPPASSSSTTIDCTSDQSAHELEPHQQLGASEFDFSARFSEVDGPPWSPAPMSTAEELFYNGKIRPLDSRPYCCSDVGSHYAASCRHAAWMQLRASPDNDGYFDFRSSANYDYRHLSAPLTPFSTPQSPQGLPAAKYMEQRRQRFGFSYYISKAPATSALEEWKKSKQGGKDGDEEGMGMRRSLGQSKSVSAVRRSRSLSPLRVFHMDDGNAQARQSTFETKRRPKKSWTLKELLYTGDNRVHQSSCIASSCAHHHTAAERGMAKTVDKTWAKCDHASPALGKKPARLPSIKRGASSNPDNLSYGVQQHQQQRGLTPQDSEQLNKKKTFPPYKHGLLGCLGFTSKSCSSSSLKGLRHTFSLSKQ